VTTFLAFLATLLLLALHALLTLTDWVERFAGWVSERRYHRRNRKENR
jgi:hypothetical protein